MPKPKTNEKMSYKQRGQLGAKIRWMNQRPVLKAAVQATKDTGDHVEMMVSLTEDVHEDLRSVAAHANTTPERLASEIISAALRGGH